MAGEINRVILIGRLGKEPDKYSMPYGATVATISLETSDSWQDEQTGEWREHIEWHRVVFFNRLADLVRRYLHQGSLIYVEGYLQTRQWQDSGQVYEVTEIVASKMQMLGRRGTKKANSPAAGGNTFSDAQRRSGYSAPPQPAYSPPYSPDGSRGSATYPPKTNAHKPPVQEQDFEQDVPFW